MWRVSVRRGRSRSLASVIAVATVAVIAPATAGAGVDGEPMPIPPPCAAPIEPVVLQSVADVEARAVGTWILCAGSTTRFWAFEGDDVGFELDADGRFSRVYADGGGRLIRAGGLLQEGDWLIQAGMPDGFFLSMSLAGAGTMPHQMTLFEGPDLMRLWGDDGVIRDYARWTGDAPVPGDPAGVGDGPCDIRSLPASLDSVAAAEARLVGTWMRCAETRRMFWAFEGDDVGFEFAADGAFHRVYPGPDGSLVRAGGWLQEGRWVIDDVYGETDVGLGMKLLGSGSSGLGATFHDDEDAMRLTDGMEGTTIHYVRWSGAAPVAGLPTGVGEGPCGQPTEPVVLESSTQVARLLVGSWTVCAGEPFGPGVIGAEFAADGSFRALVRTPDGKVVTDPTSSGATWFVHPFEEPFDIHNGAQVDIVHPDGSTRSLGPEFLASPPFVALYPASGMIATAPSVQPVPLPTTGAVALGDLAVSAAALVLIGAAAIRVSRLPIRQSVGRTVVPWRHRSVPE